MIINAYVLPQQIITDATATETTAQFETMNRSDGAYRHMVIQVEGVTTATLNLQGSIDQSDWRDIRVTNLTSGTANSNITADGLYYVEIVGIPYCRIDLSAYTSGTINVWYTLVS